MPNVSGVTGKALFFELSTGAFRSGNNTNDVRGNYSTAMGSVNTASGAHSTAIGFLNTTSGDFSIAMGYDNTASGFSSAALGYGTVASGDRSTTMGFSTSSLGYAGTAIGMYNNPILASPQTTVTSTSPLFIIGNGSNSGSLSNAMVVRKDGNVGIGTDIPAANLHIKHAAGGGLMLENSSDNNKWRIYSASGDNNLTFYNNANTEVADIDDVTGAYTAISDSRLKKNIQHMQPVLPLLLQLNPTYYQFNWQQPNEQRQIGLLAQQAHQLFPELVSYSKEKDLYKMNYAGFSTVAIKAIQEQQKEIEALKARLEKLEALLLKEQ
jgi:Chaperone of endosialidase/Head domain of trimeric autotransporter adhesin